MVRIMAEISLKFIVSPSISQLRMAVIGGTRDITSIVIRAPMMI